MSHGNLGQLGPGTGRVVGDSRDVPWQLGTTGTWDWQGSGKFLGCPMANWDNWDLILVQLGISHAVPIA